MKKINAIKSDNYDKDYFLKDCGDYNSYNKTKGEELPQRLKRSFNLGKLKKDMNILDFGCGRGEISLHAANLGCNVVSVDYSDSAIELTKKTIDKLKNVEIIKSDSSSFSYKNNHFNVIYLIDIIEHISQTETINLLLKLKKMLKKDGKIIIHTWPNSYFMNFTYPILRPILNIFYKKRLKKDIRTKYEKLMHINEQNKRKMKQIIKSLNTKSFLWFESDGLLDNMFADTIFEKYKYSNKLSKYLNNNIYLIIGNNLKQQDIVNINYDPIFMEGWYASEINHRWSKKKSRIIINNKDNKLSSINISLQPIKKNQKINIIHNKKKIKFNDKTTIYLKKGRNEIIFSSNESMIPKKEGKSEDKRELSFMLKETLLK